MDFSKLDTTKHADEGAELELLSPIDDTVLRDEKTGEAVTIKVIGTDSKDYTKVYQKIQDRRIQKRFKKGKTTITAAEMQEEAMDMLVACTKGWKHIEIEGKELAFSEDNARMLYTKFPWVREQVDAFVSDRANFLGE